MDFTKILENVFLHSKDPNIICDTEGKILKLNIAASQQFHVNQGDSLTDFLADAEVDNIIQKLQSPKHYTKGITGYCHINRLKNEPEHFGYRGLYEDQNKLWLFGFRSTSLITIKNVWSARIESLLNNDGEAIIAATKDGVIEGWSKGAELLLGYREHEIVGKSITKLIPEELVHEAKHIVAVTNKGKRVSQIETVRKHKNGNLIEVLLSVSPVFNKRKEIVGITAILLENKLATERQHRLERQATIIENSTDAIITETSHGLIDGWNKGAEKIYGYKQEEVLGKHISIIHPDRLEPEWEQHQKDILSGKSIHKFLAFRKRKDGQDLPVLFSATPLYSQKGQVKGMATISRDMSSEHAENLLNQQLSAIVKSSTDGIYSTDKNGKILTWNKGAEEIFKYTKEEMVGKNIALLFADKDEDEYQRVLAAVQGKETYNQVQTERKTKDEKVVHVSITVSPLYDNQHQLIGASIIARNITELMNIQRSLEQGLEVQEIINQILALSHYEKNAQKLYGNILSLIQCLPFSVNEIGLAFISQLNGKFVVEASVDMNFSSACASEFEKMMQENPSQNKDLIIHEDDIRQCYIHPIYYDQQLITSIVFSFNQKDTLSARDKDLISLTCSHLNLIIQAKFAQQELTNSIERLKRANQELDKFAYVVSHDLKSPLKNIALLADWIKEDLGDNIPEEVIDHINLLQARVTRLNNIIKGVLDYSKSGKESTGIAIHNPKKMIEELLSSLFIPENTKIVVKATEQPTFLDKLNIQRILQNLIENAVKYGNQENPEIEVFFDRDGRDVTTYVKDNGPGIDPKFHEKIFGIFQTLTTKDENESTGIGLSIVKKLVDENNAEIKVESSIGKGAKFIVNWHSEYEQPQ